MKLHGAIPQQFGGGRALVMSGALQVNHDSLRALNPLTRSFPGAAADRFAVREQGRRAASGGRHFRGDKVTC